MGLFKKIFISDTDAWKEFADEIGGEYIDRGFWKSKQVIVKYENWTIILDRFSRSTGKSTTTYTRIRVPLKTLDGLQFKVHKKSIFTNMGKIFGAKLIETGEGNFDRDFAIKGNNEVKIREIFSIDVIRDLISKQARFFLEIRDDEGYFNNNLSKGNYELHFESIGVIKDIDRLRDLFKIIGLLLKALSLSGSVSTDEVAIDNIK